MNPLLRMSIVGLLLLLLLLPAVFDSTAIGQLTVIPADDAVWVRHTIDQTSRGADGAKPGDINGDGWLDIVTGWEEGGKVRLYLNPGPTKVRRPWPRVTVGNVKDAEDAIFADLDSDGRLEVISCTEGRTRTVFLHRLKHPDDRRRGSDVLLQEDHWSTTAFPVTLDAQLWMQAVPLDIDGENGIDLLLGSKGNAGAIGWLQSPQSPLDLSGWKYHRLRDAAWIMSLIPQDLDGDGDADLIFTDRKGNRAGAFWLQNPGFEASRRQAAWKEHGIGGFGREVMFADVADVNGDQRLDVIVAVKPAEVLMCLQQSGGGWQQESLMLVDSALGDAKAVAVRDINGDGLADLFFTCENASGSREGIVWLEQQRNGPWRQHALGGPDGTKFDLMQILDCDADGDPDVITCEERDQLGLVWYENPFGRRTE